jgi:hypothetical protein
VDHGEQDEGQGGQVGGSEALEGEAESHRAHQAQGQLREGDEADIDDPEGRRGRGQRHPDDGGVQEIHQAMVRPSRAPREQQGPDRPHQRRAHEWPQEGREEVAQARSDPGVVVGSGPTPRAQERQQPERGQGEGEAGHRRQPAERAQRPAGGVEKVGGGDSAP